MKDLRTFTGKVLSMASLLWVWRPFVHMLYASITAPTPKGVPPDHRWVKQVIQPIDWILAFLSGIPGSLTRHVTVDS